MDGAFFFALARTDDEDDDEEEEEEDRGNPIKTDRRSRKMETRIEKTKQKERCGQTRTASEEEDSTKARKRNE